ncbi:DUF4806 domain-containing protein [Aphis craccivora]|uniref:DUF4806 domain-containing protein n=1 Tax=Aphis craccivora TaxID=307492 RepID=A0A6G0YP69_APHCR|nr:DUF4806 domain-containing protein [Aphis craccivora]
MYTSDDLLVLDNKIQDKDLRKSLVSKISLFLGKKDIRNSVRRVMAHALRLHIKHKTHTDKEIDEPLGIWLSHAPYRLQAANKNNPKY